jgi:hypothetical protein
MTRAAARKSRRLARTQPPNTPSRPKSRLPPPPDFAGAGVVVTLTDFAAEPPGPVQVNVNVAVEPILTPRVPLVGSVPLQPAVPLAVHAVAF